MHTRRDLLKLATLAGASRFAAMNAFAQAPASNDYKALVCVFLFGGNDANNMVMPQVSAEYNAYKAIRGNVALPDGSAQVLGVTASNGTPYGLEGYVFTGDEERGMRLARGIRAGGVKVNGSTMMSLNLMAPRPGWGLSGMGVEGTIETLRFFCGPRVVGVEGPMNFGH